MTKKSKKDKIKGNIETLYLIPFICGCNNIKDASLFLEENANLKVKIPNFTKKINILINKNYITLTNNPSKTKHCKKELKINNNKIIDDFIFLLKNATNNFVYKFKINGKPIIKKKRFSYDKKCRKLENILKIKKNMDLLINIISIYSKILLIVKSKDKKITRITKNFSYYNIIEQVIDGFALNKTFVQEYNYYIDEERIMIHPKLKITNKNNELISRLKNISKNYKLIKNLNENSINISSIINI